MRLRVLLLAALVALPFAAAGPTGEDPTPWGAAALVCADVCWTSTPGDRADAAQEVLGLFVLHERSASSRPTSSWARDSTRLTVPILVAAAETEMSDESCCAAGSGAQAVGTTRTLHLLASGAPGAFVLDGGRTYGASRSGSDGSSSDVTHARDSLRAGETASTGGTTSVSRTTSYDAARDRTIETVYLTRQVTVGETRHDVNLTLRLESDHLRGVGWLTLRGNVGTRLVDQRALLPLDLP